MALRVEQLRALKTFLLNFILKSTMDMSKTMGNLMINTTEAEQAEVLVTMDKYKLPKQLHNTKMKLKIEYDH